MTSFRSFPSDLYREHARFLWGLAYRLTGCAADADDLVQETFARALSDPPQNMDQPLRPWLARVAVNLGKDLLRRRRRLVYDGPWLPSPVETEEAGLAGEEDRGGSSAEVRYEMLESVTFAFLLALEALNPLQRATLLLRDVFDYSVREVAQAVGLSEANVRTTHHRARRAMAAYDRGRRPRGGDLPARARESLMSFVKAVEERDIEALERLLAPSVCAISDAGGEFTSARKPVVGRSEVARLYVGLAAMMPSGGRFDICTMNGLPALVCEVPPIGERWARRWVSRCEVDPSGLILEVHSVLATRKLTAVRF